MTGPRPYANPYLAGAGLGAVLLACFVVSGQGLGASGAFANVAAGLVATAAPKVAAHNSYFSSYLAEGVPWTAWMVIEIAGVIAGAALSAILAGRFRLEVAAGAGVARAPRLLLAFAGGAIMGLGAVLARGCTSGQGLSGGAMLSVGSWTFLAALFLSGYATAPLVRRLWR